MKSDEWQASIYTVYKWETHPCLHKTEMKYKKMGICVPNAGRYIYDLVKIYRSSRFNRAFSGGTR